MRCCKRVGKGQCSVEKGKDRTVRYGKGIRYRR